MRLLIINSVLFLVCTVCLSYAAINENISVLDVYTSVVDDKVKVDCEIQYGVHSQIREALSNGIEMAFSLEIELRQENAMWLDPRVGYLEREFKVKYHALSKQYVMLEQGSHVERSFPDLYSAFYYQRRLHNADLASTDSVSQEQTYYLRARARLLSEKLPLPLRIKSYLSSNWRPSSGWTVWPM